MPPLRQVLAILPHYLAAMMQAVLSKSHQQRNTLAVYQRSVHHRSHITM